MPRSRTSKAKLFVAAAMLVACAFVAASAGATASNKMMTATDVEYNALDAAPVNCDKGSDGYNGDLPRWDPEYSTQEDFYNACYYSFRCCTTTGNGNGCYVSDNFGNMCRSCLKSNGPKFVKGDCVNWLTDEDNDVSSWTVDDLMADNGIPSTNIPSYAVLFENFANPSCWQNRGAGDKMVMDYADKCFEVLSWCNLLCPRDTPQTVDHVMCKHCTLFGFEQGYWDKENFDQELTAIGN